MMAGGTRPTLPSREKAAKRMETGAILTALSLFCAPFFTFVIAICTVSFFSYMKGNWYWAGLVVAVAGPGYHALAAWSMDPDEEKEYKMQRRSLFYVWVTGAALVAGLLLGYILYTEIFHQYYAVQMGETYRNVVPTVGANQFADATIIEFEASARVNTFQSGAYRRHRCDPLGPAFLDFLCWGSNLYCVAPVMGGVQQSEVQYWSIGEDCCAEEGSFACGAVVQADTTQGKNCLVEVAPNEWFQSAVNLTLSKYRLASSPDAIFCRFVNSVADDLDGQRREGLGLLVSMCVVAAAVCALIASQFYAQLD